MPNLADTVFAGTAHVYKQGAKGEDHAMTPKAVRAYQKAEAIFDKLTADEMGVVLLIHLVDLGRRIEKK